MPLQVFLGLSLLGGFLGIEQGLVVRGQQGALEAAVAEQSDEALAQLGLVLGVGADTGAEALDDVALSDANDTGGHVGDIASLAKDAVDGLGHGSRGKAGDDGEVLDEHGDLFEFVDREKKVD
ncbi:MAG: hypothetical protein BYD32DRAFT_213632 [Podila humilis]|nr:MAG: hypothetical protein BYD32DRAFT_213632 [Podila humilis]